MLVRLAGEFGQSGSVWAFAYDHQACWLRQLCERCYQPVYSLVSLQSAYAQYYRYVAWEGCCRAERRDIYGVGHYLNPVGDRREVGPYQLCFGFGHAYDRLCPAETAS